MCVRVCVRHCVRICLRARVFCACASLHMRQRTPLCAVPGLTVPRLEAADERPWRPGLLPKTHVIKKELLVRTGRGSRRGP